MENEEIYKEVESIINGLTGMAMMSGDIKTLSEYIKRSELVFTKLRRIWKLEE